MNFLWGLLTSRLGLAAVLCLALFGWHAQDKKQALKHARDGYVQEFELAAVQAELTKLQKRMRITREANQTLQEKVQWAEGEAIRFASELEAFERDTEINPECVVDSDLLLLLRHP